MKYLADPAVYPLNGCGLEALATSIECALPLAAGVEVDPVSAAALTHNVCYVVKLLTAYGQVLAFGHGAPYAGDTDSVAADAEAEAADAVDTGTRDANVLARRKREVMVETLVSWKRAVGAAIDAHSKPFLAFTEGEKLAVSCVTQDDCKRIRAGAASGRRKHGTAGSSFAVFDKLACVVLQQRQREAGRWRSRKRMAQAAVVWGCPGLAGRSAPCDRERVTCAGTSATVRPSRGAVSAGTTTKGMFEADTAVWRRRRRRPGAPRSTAQCMRFLRCMNCAARVRSAAGPVRKSTSGTRTPGTGRVTVLAATAASHGHSPESGKTCMTVRRGPAPGKNQCRNSICL